MSRRDSPGGAAGGAGPGGAGPPAVAASPDGSARRPPVASDRPTASPAPRRGPAWVWAAMLGALALTPSWNSLQNPGILDDLWIYVENPALRSRPIADAFFDPGTYSVHPRFNAVCYRPLMTASLAWDARRTRDRSDLSPARRTNLLLHALNSALAFGLAGAFLAWRVPGADPAARRRVAAVAAGLFALHPISAFSAQYVSNRGFLLFVAAYFTALIRALTPGRGPAADVPLWVGLGLLAKETGVATPVALGMVWVLSGAGGGAGAAGETASAGGSASADEAAVKDQPGVEGTAVEPGEVAPVGAARAWRRVAVGVGLVLGAYFALRAGLGLGGNQLAGAVSWKARLGAFVAQFEIHFREYLPAFFAPGRVRWMAAHPPADPTRAAAWAATLAAAAALVGAWGSRRRAPVVAACVLFYPLTLIPTTLLKQPVPVNFYRLYPGSLFLYLGLAWVAHRRLARPAWVVACLAALLAAGISARRVGPRQRTVGAAVAAGLPYGLSLTGRLMAIESLGAPAQKADALTRLIDGGERNARVYKQRAVARLGTGDYGGAREDLEVVLAAYPYRADDWAWLEVAAHGSGATDRRDEAAASRRRRFGVGALELPETLAQQALKAGHLGLAAEALAAMRRRGRCEQVRRVAAAVAAKVPAGGPHEEAFRELTRACEAGGPR